MKISFTEQKKKEKILIIVFALVFVITIVNVWFNVLKPDETAIPVIMETSIQSKNVIIDFSVFDMEVLNSLNTDYLDELDDGQGNFNKSDLFKK